MGTTATEIQAAIDKLLKLEVDSTPGVWGHWPEAGDIEIFATNDGDARGGDFHIVAAQVCPGAGYGAPIYSDNYEPNAELITTLHATITAQRAFLGVVLEARVIERNWETLIYTRAALELARAINGTERD